MSSAKARFATAKRNAAAAICLATALTTAASAGTASAQQKGKPTPSAAPATSPAPGTAPHADVETAESLYAKLDYEQANLVAERVIKQRGLSHDQLVRAYRVLAVTHAYLDREEAARDAFLLLLVYDPEYTVDPNQGPKVNTPFVEARGNFRALAAKPGIEVGANVRSDGGQLRVTTRDPRHMVKTVNVGYRWTSSGEYTVARVAAGDRIPVEVTAAPVGRTRLDFYAQALDDKENAIFEAGNPLVPKSAFVEAGGGGGGGKESGSILSSPFFWIVTSAAVVGGGAALFFALRPQDPPTSAELSPVLNCGLERCR